MYDEITFYNGFNFHYDQVTIEATPVEVAENWAQSCTFITTILIPL